MSRIAVLPLVVAAMILAACGDDPPPTGCGPSNCAGCCAGDVCQGGTATTACGGGGGACVACGASLACLSNRTCGLDPNAIWRVQPLSAQIAPDNNGSSWDGDGSPPDVFAGVGCPGTPDTSSATPSVESYTPTWSSGGCTAKASDLLGRGFSFQLWDEDVTFDDTITNALSFSSLTQAHFQAGEINFQPSGGMMSLRVALQRQ